MKTLIFNSPWPLLVAINLGLLLVNVINSQTYIFVCLVILIGCLYCWVRDFYLENKVGRFTSLIGISMKYAFAMFLLTETMYFIALFWCVISNKLSPTLTSWPPFPISPGDPVLPLLGTVLLIGSSISATAGHHYYMGGNSLLSSLYHVVTILLGVSFMGVTSAEFYAAGFTISDGIYGSIVYMLLGTHLVHVLLGLVTLVISPNGKCREYAIYYWHYVDTVWLFVYALIYVWTSVDQIDLWDDLYLAVLVPLSGIHKGLLYDEENPPFLKEGRKGNPHQELYKAGVFSKIESSNCRLIMYTICTLLVLQMHACRNTDIFNKRIKELSQELIHEDAKLREWAEDVIHFSDSIIEDNLDVEIRPSSRETARDTLSLLLAYPEDNPKAGQVMDQLLWISLVHFSGFSKEICTRISLEVGNFDSEVRPTSWGVQNAESKGLHPSMLVFKDGNGIWRDYKNNPLSDSGTNGEEVIQDFLDNVKLFDNNIGDLVATWGTLTSQPDGKLYYLGYLKDKPNHLKIYLNWLKLNILPQYMCSTHLLFQSIAFVYFLEERIKPGQDRIIRRSVSSGECQKARRALLSNVRIYGSDVELRNGRIVFLNDYYSLEEFKPLSKGTAWQYRIFLYKFTKYSDWLAIMIKREDQETLDPLKPYLKCVYPSDVVNMLPGQPGFVDIPGREKAILISDILPTDLTDIFGLEHDFDNIFCSYR